MSCRSVHERNLGRKYEYYAPWRIASLTETSAAHRAIAGIHICLPSESCAEYCRSSLRAVYFSALDVVIL